MTDYGKLGYEEYLQLASRYLDESDDEVTYVLEELLGGSPRAGVLIGAAWLDDYLSDLLKLALPDDDIVTKVFLTPVSSFRHRIEAAYNLGIISKRVMGLLHNIRLIRNKFAHRVAVTFDDPEVAKLVAKLELLPTPDVKPSQESHLPQKRYALQVVRLFILFKVKVNEAQKSSDLASRLEILRVIGEGEL